MSQLGIKVNKHLRFFTFHYTSYRETLLLCGGYLSLLALKNRTAYLGELHTFFTSPPFSLAHSLRPETSHSVLHAAAVIN